MTRRAGARSVDRGGCGVLTTRRWSWIQLRAMPPMSDHIAPEREPGAPIVMALTEVYAV